MIASLATGRRCAFTLIELVISITVFGIIAALGTGVLVEVARGYARTKAASGALTDCQFALNRIGLELASLDAPTDISSMDEDEITFTVFGVSRRYYRSGSTLRRDSYTLAEDCSQFALTYYKSDGTLTSDPSQVHRIAAEIAITRDGSTVSLRTEVFPRQFRSAYLSWEEN